MIDNNFINRVMSARKDGKTIGLVQGSWDLFHLGHLLYIKEARKLCDYLVVAMDSDEKIRKRKGNGRPIIPEEERSEFIRQLNIADEVVVKDVNEPKWNLIKNIKPDVLIVIKDNYSDEEIVKLEEICGKVAILPRQASGSTSDIIRKVIISDRNKKLEKSNDQLLESIDGIKQRTGFNENSEEPIPMLFEELKSSTDYISPVAAAIFLNGKWQLGSNKIDTTIPKQDIEKRTELFYATVEHAEMNLLKKLQNIDVLNEPIFVTLFPCDRCMKVLIDKGIKEIFYLEDHPEKNWSKRSHELASKHNIKTTQINSLEKLIETDAQHAEEYKYIYPPNARTQEQLDIMMHMEYDGKDPLDPKYINQNILFTTDYWYISENKFPYEGVEHQFLIVAKNEIYSKENITTEMWDDLKKIWIYLSQVYDIPGGALCMRFGEPSLSGATLKRFHVHLIQPKENEKTKFSIGGHQYLKKGLHINKDNE